jgi:hypothetical protein
MAYCSTDSLQALRSITMPQPQSYGRDPRDPQNPSPSDRIPPQMYGCPDDCVGNHLYGFISSNVAAGASASSTAQPQVRNQPRRLFLTETVADNFLITNIEVGICNLLGTTGAISASIFIPNAECPDFKRTVCEVSQTVTVAIQNQSGAAATFAATMSAYLIGDSGCR